MASKRDYRDPQPQPASGDDSPRVEHTYERPTDKQVAYATSLAVKAGYPRNYALSAARRAMNGKTPVGDMNRQECSELINWLKSKVG